MNTIKTTLVAIILLLSSTSSISADTPPVKQLKDYSVVELINYVAPMYGQDPELIGKITWCESGNIVASHDGGQGKNVTGLHDETFDVFLPAYIKKYGETLDKKSTFDQLKMMSFIFSLGEKERRLWTTYVAYKNGGSYTFPYKGKPYTAHCK